MIMEKNYFIGLDIGTESVGYAVTDEGYKLIKAKGQDLWGSYLFDSAKTAVERRGFRTARRRLARVHQRLMLLQSLFAEEIAKVDPTFFIRLNDSKLFLEDKDGQIHTKYVLFGDPSYTDKEYFKEYPTIFHLRAALLDGEIKDIRLLYLAVHHIIKNRGHFLFEGQTFNAGSNDAAKQALININVILSDNDFRTLDLEKIDDCLKVIKAQNVGKKEKTKALKDYFKIGAADKQLAAIVSGLIGGNANVKDVFCLEDEEPLKFTFDNEKFDENVLPQIEKAVGTEQTELVLQMKAVYDWAVLSNILKGKKYISQAKIEIFNKHKADLDALKKYVKDNCPEKYKTVFRHKDKLANYAAYIGMDKNHGYSKAKKDDFYTFLKKEVKITDERILSEIENGSFMPKQITNANGVIPYQVNLMELTAILNNASKYFAFLGSYSDPNSVQNRIISLMTFRVPYYVGPLNTASGKAWAIRREGQERTVVTPWNFNEVIDADASEEKFIARMTNKCTYLTGVDVLSDNSILYSEFKFLNEINNLTVCGVKNEAARKLIIAYARLHKKPTLNRLCDMLIREGVLPKGAKAKEVFGGIDEEIKNNLSTYVTFKEIIGDKVDSEPVMCEEIIKWATIISDRERLERRIKNAYGAKLTDEEIKGLAAVKCSGWGRFSKELLTEIYCKESVDYETGEYLNIIDTMRKTGKNFMQLLSNDYGYVAAIDDFNGGAGNTNVTYKTIEDLYCSPSVKRAIWRTVILVREIVKIRGASPRKIFIEMARAEGEKNKRTVSRKQRILDLYKKIKDESRDWVKEIEGLDDGKFNSDKVYLYYMQKGRCMYTDESIKFEDLFVENVYDIDHIYPQSKIKDDSYDNRVLVKKQVNSSKTDIYPLDAAIRAKMQPFWKMLKDKELISAEKYARLTRTTPLSADELAAFVARQLVETRQSTKAAAEILKKMYPETEIVYVKARDTADFKNENKMIKVRELNDYHHAKDAFANVVVGNVYNVKYGHNPLFFFKNNKESDYHIKRTFCFEVKGAWKPEYIEAVKKTYNKNTCTVVRFSGEGKGGLFNATVKTAGANDKLIPLKVSGAISDTSKYGGYDSATTAYFALIKSLDKKSLPMLTLECVTILTEKEINGDKEKLAAYCANTLGLKSPEVIIPKIKLNTLFRIDGSYAYLRGRTGKQLVWCNANELIPDNVSAEYLKHITSYFNGLKKFNTQAPVDEKYDKITSEENVRLYGVLLEKLSSKVYAGLALSGQKTFLAEKTEKFGSLDLTDQCKVLMQVLTLMQCNSIAADLSLLDGVSHAGINLSAKVVGNKDIQIIYRSPTGYYTEVIDLKKFL